jgi:hypothetical protein
VKTAPVVDSTEPSPVLRGESCLSLGHSRLSTQALRPHRRLGGSTAESAGPEHVMPGPPLLGVCDSISDHNVDETVLHQDQKAVLLRDLQFGVDI